MRNVFWFVVGMFAVFAGVAAAGDVPGIGAEDFPVSPDAHWMWTALGGSVFATLLAALGKLIQSVIAGIRDARIARACEFVYAGTMACYHEYVRAAKAAGVDGRLTVAEKDEALQYAYRKAVEIARTQGFDLLKTMGKETVLALIERYVGQSKLPAAAKAALAPLPDLAP